MTQRTLRFLLPVVVAAPLIAAVGGWAVTTIEDVPDYATARRPLDLTFTVRQHGEEPTSGLSGSVEARKGPATLRAVATSNGTKGQYTTRLNLPEPGDWTLTVNGGYSDSRATLTLPVVAAGAAAPAPLSDMDRGRRLFNAKGCVTCHLHAAVAGSGRVKVGPELTDRRFAPEYLQQFLANPSIKPPTPGVNARMPNLGLKPAEIAALVAFINGERQASR